MKSVSYYKVFYSSNSEIRFAPPNRLSRAANGPNYAWNYSNRSVAMPLVTPRRLDAGWVQVGFLHAR